MPCINRAILRCVAEEFPESVVFVVGWAMDNCPRFYLKVSLEPKQLHLARVALSDITRQTTLTLLCGEIYDSNAHWKAFTKKSDHGTSDGSLVRIPELRI